MSAPVEKLIQRLHAKRSGNGWIAKCPAHDDHKPSLSIDEGADGRALIKVSRWL
jgi:DNA primase